MMLIAFMVGMHFAPEQINAQDIGVYAGSPWIYVGGFLALALLCLSLEKCRKELVMRQILRDRDNRPNYIGVF